MRNRILQDGSECGIVKILRKCRFKRQEVNIILLVLIDSISCTIITDNIRIGHEKHQVRLLVNVVLLSSLRQICGASSRSHPPSLRILRIEGNLA